MNGGRGRAYSPRVRVRSLGLVRGARPHSQAWSLLGLSGALVGGPEDTSYQFFMPTPLNVTLRLSFYPADNFMQKNTQTSDSMKSETKAGDKGGAGQAQAGWVEFQPQTDVGRNI